MVAMQADKLLDSILPRTAVEPRPYQRRICLKTFNYIANQQMPSVLIESATGSGKTVMGLMAIKMLQEAFGYSAGWMTLGKEIRHQAEKENQVKCINADVKFFSIFEKEPPKVDILLIDEAQHDACNSASHIHNAIKPKIILGTTATPYRTDHVKLVFTKVVKDAGIGQLIKDGYLSPYDHYCIPDWDPVTVANTYLNSPDRFGMSFMFFLTEDRCAQCVERLASQGVPVELISAKTDRERQLNDMRDNRLRVLVGMRTIAEGVDLPALASVFVRDSGRGPSIQMAGRVFRKWAACPIKNVIQSKQTRWPLSRTAKPVTNYLLEEDNTWRTIHNNPHLDALVAKTTIQTSLIDVKMPNYILKKQAKKKRRPPWGKLGP